MSHRLFACLLFFSFALLFYFSLSTGPTPIASSSLISWLWSENLTSDELIAKIRFERTMTCYLVGSLLALSGSLLQTLLKNPLAEPYTLGLSGGATIGFLIPVILVVEQPWAFPLGAFFGCWVSTGILFRLHKNNSMNPNKILLTGLMLTLFFGSVLVVGLAALDPVKLQSTVFWMMGQAGTFRDQAWPLALLVLWIMRLWMYQNSKKVDALLTGESFARSLGIQPEKLRRHGLLLITLATAITCALMGLVGFIGIIAPHITYKLLRSRRHEYTHLHTTLVGGVLLMLADTLGRIVLPNQDLPAGSLVALIGAPLLIYLLTNRRTYAEAS